MSTSCVPEGFSSRTDGSTGFRVVQALPEPEGRRDSVKPQMESLVNELADDLDAAFERLVRVFQDRLFSFAHRLCGSRADAEEVAQDAFVRAYRALKTYPAERIRSLALQAWLYRITLNVSRNRLRGKYERRLVSIDQAGPNGDAARHAWEGSDDPESRPDRRFEEAEKRADIASLVATLPDRYRSAIILRYVEGLSLEEVAAILKQPLGTAKSNVHRAVNLLRRAITDSRRAKARAEVRA
jgi:RNA polymerase sigma-70 factor (ECF subfamily)